MRKFNKYKIISFDIFDTLINRNVLEPMQIFDLIEIKYNKIYKDKIKNFKKYRIICEENCRKNISKEEVTLNEIYIELQQYYSENEIKRLKKLEKEIEILMCTENNNGKKLYEKLKKTHKIVITSDMYLDIDTIKKMLKKCGYNDYYKLYLSSELLLTKKNKTIYKYIKDDLNLKLFQLVHIGDNKKSDYLNAILSGFSAVLVKKNKHRNNDNILNNIITALAENNLNKKDYFYSFGYQKLGPLLYFFTKWLYEDLQQKGINNVYFFSRDGYILHNIFEIMYNKGKINNSYFYASRRSIIIPSFWKLKDVNKIIEAIHWDQNFTIDTMLKKLGLDDYELQDVLEKYKLSLNSMIRKADLVNDDNIKKLLNELYPIIIDNSKKEYSEFNKYLNKMNFSGKLAIVDIGWYGNMQKSIEELMNDTEMYGYYVGLNPKGENQKRYNMKGYLFDKSHGYEIYEIEKSINSIFELLFTAPHGSVKKFNSQKKDFVEFYDYEFNDEELNKNIYQMQKAAVKFVTDFDEINKNFDLTEDAYKAVEQILKMAIKPKYKDVVNFGDLTFFDNEIRKIATPSSIFTYIIKPKKFIKDLKNSYWKVGFLKRFLIFNAPYYKLYKKITKIERK